jgi:EAL domain-containing protein (putative c-di-GMP-specific phosphodiesterase class I)
VGAGIPAEAAQAGRLPVALSEGLSKIDGSFVKGVLHGPIDREMVRSINEIGHLTGKQTIAEWAENAEIIEVLRGLGVDYAQGYGVSQPQRVQRVAIA